jgi:hypothetical protein
MAAPGTPPRPLLGSAYTMCPAIDPERAGQLTEDEAQLLSDRAVTCRWRKRGQGTAARRSFRRHWLRAHWRPFRDGPAHTLGWRYPQAQVAQYGYPGTRITAMIDRPGHDHPDGWPFKTASQRPGYEAAP